MREFKDLKIAVAGTGYVGLSIATLLSQHHQVTAVDIIPEKVELINNKKSPIRDDYMQSVFCFKQTLYNEKRYDLIAIRGILKVLKKINGENKIYKKILLSYAEHYFKFHLFKI